MKRITLTLLVTLLVSIAQADLKADADSIYQTDDYATAALLYDSLITTQGPSAEAYYNLGNCHYKMQHVAASILNYERALRLAPSDDDILFNLELSRLRTIDRITPASNMFLVSWWLGFARLFTSDAWCWIAIALFALSLIIYFVRRTDLLNMSPSTLQTTYIAALALTVVSLLASITHANQFNNTDEAIVTRTATTVRSTPSSTGVELFVLHEGTKVDILDESIDDWHEVQLADGKKGWIPTADIERI